MEFLLRLWLVVFILTLAWSASGAERVAIVFGNDAYTHAPKLENAINDAGAVAEMLETQLDFKLVKPPKSRMFSRQEAIWSDCGLERFYAGIEAFMREAATARLGLVYYAGHGMEVDKTNYLIPVDAELSSRVQLRTQAVNVVDILADLKATGLPNKLLILDCCRDDPLTRSWRGTRSSAKGLAELTDTDIPESTLILFSAAPGQAALDGEGDNSPFTASLIEELPRPGRDALSAFFEVSDAVVKKTGNRQEPWIKFDGAGRTFRGFQFVEGIPNGQVKSKTDEELAAKLAAMQQEIERLKREKNRPQTTASEPKPMSIPQSPSGGHSAGTRGFTNSLGMEFVPVPGTEVLFSIYETRVKDYAAYASANSEVTSEWRDVSYGGQRQTSDHPVVNVSWEDAKAFCAWLSRKEGKTYRLPTDHEWSVAVGIGKIPRPARRASLWSTLGGRRGLHHEGQETSMVKKALEAGLRLMATETIILSRRRWDRMKRTQLDCMTWEAMSGSGARTSGIHRRRLVCCGVVPGTTAIRTISCRRTASASIRRVASTTAGFVVWWWLVRRAREVPHPFFLSLGYGHRQGPDKSGYPGTMRP